MVLVNDRPANASLADRFGRLARDTRGVGAVEFALIVPILFFVLGMAVWASQALTLDRKITQAARTLIDLAAQQSNIGLTGSSYTYSQILSAAGLIVTPFDTASLSMVLSEVQVTGPTSATVIWSQASGGGVPLTPGSSMTLSDSSSNWSGGPGYLLVGTVSYNFQPFGAVLDVAAMTFTRTLYMAPYNNEQVQCCS